LHKAEPGREVPARAKSSNVGHAARTALVVIEPTPGDRQELYLTTTGDVMKAPTTDQRYPMPDIVA